MATTKLVMNSTQKILLKRGLNKNGKGQEYFTKQCAKAFNNYVPFDTGRLKDMAVEMQTDKIIYSAPYARRQYLSNKGTGKGGFCRGGLRGPFWDKRAWINHGNEIVKSVAEFCGGKAK